MIVRLMRQCLGTDEAGCNTWQQQTEIHEMDPGRCALILCDVWDNHWCRGANLRLAPMLPAMDRLARSLREQGTLILHAPSETMAFYEGSPARLRMQQVPRQVPQAVRTIKDMPLPVDASDGGGDTREPEEWVDRPVWHRQHPAILIDEARDGISDDGEEVYSCLKQRDISQVFLMGVHTNMCVLNRSFAIKNLVRWGFDVALVRDLTDCMYNPAMPPYVSHEQGLELIVGYIEKFWCPTVLSQDLLAGAQ